MLKSSGLQTEDVLLLEGVPEISTSSNRTVGLDIAPLCLLPADPSSGEYHRSGAVAYAHQWATASRPYNPDYFDFTDYGGDCNNFVSQAIHEGGSAQMIGEGTYGWYYNSVDDYAAAWTGVYYLFKFVTQYADFPAGPEGCAVSMDQAEIGDVIQYSWEGNNYWNHTVIIVQTEEDEQGNIHHNVAGHSPDVDFYPFEFFIVDYPDMIYRFLHIERVDGSKLYIPLISH